MMDALRQTYEASFEDNWMRHLLHNAILALDDEAR
jgi:hypothetical protein